MFPLLSHQSLLIFLVGFVGSFIGTHTGGIGLIVVPVLMLCGLTPQESVAAMRISVTLGDMMSLAQLQRAGKVIRSMTVPVLLLGIAGALIGSEVLLWTPGPLAEKLLSGFILLTVFLSLLKPGIGVHPRHHQPQKMKALGYASIFILSIISTYFSAATGLLGRTTLMMCFGQTFLESSATRKVQSLGMGVTSTVIFILSGTMHWTAAAILVPAITLGSMFGSQYAIRKGDRWVRHVFLIIVFGTALILLIK